MLGSTFQECSQGSFLKLFFFCSAQLDLNLQWRLLTFFHDLVRRFVVFLFKKTKEMAGFFQKKHLQALPCRGIASSWAATVVNCKSGMLHLQSCWALPRCNGRKKKSEIFRWGWVGLVGLVWSSFLLGTWWGCSFCICFFQFEYTRCDYWFEKLFFQDDEMKSQKKKSGLRSSFVFSFMETITRNPWQSTT